jgi:predicted SpoU family rRNA methylase
VTTRDDRALGYTDICAGLSARFGTPFGLEITGEWTTLVAKFEGGIEVMITDCGVSLSPVDWHLDGRAAGFYVGVHTAASNFDGVDEEMREQVGYACDPEALPTVEAIGELVYQALAYARFLREAT